MSFHPHSSNQDRYQVGVFLNDRFQTGQVQFQVR